MGEAAASRTRLLNPAAVLTWNTHKGYLRDLADQGVPIVPTAWVSVGASTTLAQVMDDNLWTDVVAKPVVGAGSYLTERIRDPESPDAMAFWQRLVGEREAMVQPYLQSVEEYGERSVMWIDGELTHAIRKSPRLGDARSRCPRRCRSPRMNGRSRTRSSLTSPTTCCTPAST